MTFEESKNFRMPFGKYKGKTLDEIAKTDEGLRYLDWLRDSPNLWIEMREAIEAYLGDASIAKELDELIG